MEQQQVIQQQFKVSYNYAITFTHGVFDISNPTLLHTIQKEPSVQQPKISVVVDEGLLLAQPGLIETITAWFNRQSYKITNKNILIVPGGEAVKNDPVYTEQVLDLINRNKTDRHSFLIAIGGGAVLDTAGYAAAIAHRGVRLIRIPTTVLSQNDSGVGVKNSINYFGKKNFLGTFAPPFAVINDSHFLTTLSERNWRSGISEAIKVALIKDAVFFNWIEANTSALNNRDLAVMEQLIFRCAQLHTEHIATAGDPFEQGSSRPLDFGHWAAHKLEQLTNYQLTHGEAVAIGIALDASYSYLALELDHTSIERILNTFLSLGFSITHPILHNRLEDILEGLEEFREHLGGRLTVMLLNAIGKGAEVHTLDPKLIANSVQYNHTFSQSILTNA
jgi:3-dehydroquinate synthase